MFSTSLNFTHQPIKRWSETRSHQWKQTWTLSTKSFKWRLQNRVLPANWKIPVTRKMTRRTRVAAEFAPKGEEEPNATTTTRIWSSKTRWDCRRRLTTVQWEGASGKSQARVSAEGLPAVLEILPVRSPWSLQTIGNHRSVEKTDSWASFPRRFLWGSGSPCHPAVSDKEEKRKNTRRR